MRVRVGRRVENPKCWPVHDRLPRGPRATASACRLARTARYCAALLRNSLPSALLTHLHFLSFPHLHLSSLPSSLPSLAPLLPPFPHFSLTSLTSTLAFLTLVLLPSATSSNLPPSVVRTPTTEHRAPGRERGQALRLAPRESAAAGREGVATFLRRPPLGSVFVALHTLCRCWRLVSHALSLPHTLSHELQLSSVNKTSRGVTRNRSSRSSGGASERD